ncbi:general substrate transporter [Cryphonectria parasitica EP155]|uniref:General substrate transporter n=1 Tax=Cryphonectria parasitica (strain ATCC 38755 / EP155) TaxID=660469 RepID=A0A9P4XS14_CRYP1|nr:general substrate transporter [Cryphonectria parasitica EP155]KAF3760344.1 general substrate transporter [Cryphonectria parasitica EP155]
MTVFGPKTYAWFCALSAALCNSYYGFDASVYNAVQGIDNWKDWMGDPGAETIGGVNTAYSVCAIVSGWFLAAPCADFLGRKFAMAIGSILIMIGAILETFTKRHTLGMFIAGRAIIGLGQGIALSAAPAYIGEITPHKIRGIVMTFWQVCYSIGLFFAFWINYACTKYTSRLPKNWDWRIVCIFQLLVPVYVLTILPFLPGSPRWYIKNGKTEKARKALLATRPTPEGAEEELQSIIQAVEFEKTSTETSAGYSALWKDRSVRKRLLLAIGMNAGQQLTGQGSLSTYSTKIYEKVFSSSSTIALINALNATFSILFCLNVTWIVERWGRKVLFIVGGMGMACCMLIVATVETQTPTTADGGKSHSVGVAIVFLLFLFIFFYKPSWGAVTWIWTSEIFSLNVRAQGVGMAGQTQNIANAIVQQFFPTFLNNCGFYAFYMFAGINCLLVLYVIFLIPETKGVPLEEMDKLFGGANHVQAGAEILQEEQMQVDQHKPKSDHSSTHGDVTAKPEAELV